jgi:homoserine O-acetyltransferase
VFNSKTPLSLSYHSSPLPTFDIAYETWGTLSPTRDNVILLHTGLSASSHAASTPANRTEGWWEKFIGPGKPLDTNTFFVVCTNVLGGCYGSTGPSSVDPETGVPYATHFPILSIFDMVRAQFHLLDHLGVDKLYASVGSSMGAMQSLAAGWLYPERVGKVVSISGTARSTPSSIAMRYAQRSGM